MRYFITWVESDKAEQIEELLDANQIAIDMLPTPEEVREAEVLVCKDCFELFLTDIKAIQELSKFPFPAETRCFNDCGELLWAKVERGKHVFSNLNPSVFARVYAIKELAVDGMDTDGVPVPIYGLTAPVVKVGDVVEGHLLNDPEDEDIFFLDAKRIVPAAEVEARGITFDVLLHEESKVEPDTVDETDYIQVTEVDGEMTGLDYDSGLYMPIYGLLSVLESAAVGDVLQGQCVVDEKADVILSFDAERKLSEDEVAKKGLKFTPAEFILQ